MEKWGRKLNVKLSVSKTELAGSNPAAPAKERLSRTCWNRVQIVAMATLGMLHWSVKPVLAGSNPARHPKFRFAPVGEWN